jgi:hypothetical protein
MSKIVKIAVEGVYTRGTTTHINATQTAPYHTEITRRQYDSACRRLALPTGEGLRLAPVGDDVGAVVVRDGNRDYAVIS